MLFEHKKALKAAFPITLPVLTGFLFLGIAYGILMSANGFNLIVTTLISVFVFAGSMQYVAVNLLVSAFNPLYAFLIALMVNARHLFYGLSMLDRYKNAGKIKPLLIFTMCDETFSVLCGSKTPKDVNDNLFMAYVSVLNYLYWVLGTALGAAAGNFITFNTEGIDFALTALFIVIFVNQWKETKNHIPALIGLVCSAAALLIFGPDRFLIPAMAAILLLLTVYRPAFTKKEAA